MKKRGRKKKKSLSGKNGEQKIRIEDREKERGERGKGERRQDK
jgi:hypothetical protein